MHNKKRIEQMLASKEARKKELVTKGQAATEITELRSINSELETVNGDIAELRNMLEDMPDDEPDGTGNEPLEGRSNIPGAKSPIGRSQVLGTYGVSSQQKTEKREEEPDDIYNTLEYRKAFMKFARSGEITQELRVNTEQRANEITTTTNVSAVVPTTIMNEVVKKVTVYGQVYNGVRKLNVKGGVAIPILSLKPTATWIGETTSSDKKKVQANTKVTFTYYGLECKVSTSLLADTVTLVGFETTIIDLIVEAMIKAIDLAVIAGDGTGKPLGITKDERVPSTQVVSLSSTEFAEWTAWKKKVFAKMSLAYKAGASFLMASGTFEGYIDGMVDANKQPIGRVNYGITEGPQERFGGKAVIEVEDDVIANYDDAAVGDVVAIYCNLKNYGFNSNMQMTMFRYLDHDTNEWVDKAILIADGKLIDPNGVVIIKKGA